MILYIENPKDATRILVELINKFGEVSGYKSNTQKLLPSYSVYTNSERPENSFFFFSFFFLSFDFYLFIFNFFLNF